VRTLVEIVMFRHAFPTVRGPAPLVLLLLASLRLFGQDIPPAKPEIPRGEDLSRTVLLFCRFDPDSTFTEIQRRLLVESLVTKLGSATPEIGLRQYPRTSFGSNVELDQITELSGADAWLAATISGDMTLAKLNFQAHDLQKDQDFFSMEITGPIDSRFRNAFGGLWSPVIRKMRETIHSFRQYNTLAVTGPADTWLELDGKPAVRLDSQGQASISLLTPASYRYSLYLPGHKTAQGSIFIESASSLELAPVARLPLAVSLGLEWLAFPYIGLELSVVPDILSFETQAIAYGLGITPSVPTESSSYLIKDYGLLNFLIGLRWQILAHRWPIQLAIGAGGQVRFLTTNYLRTDPLAPGGWYLLAGVSLDLTPELALFADLTPRFTISSDSLPLRSALAASRLSTSPGNLVLISDPLIIEPLHFTLGLRWQP
jgi:hypothetical protein